MRIAVIDLPNRESGSVRTEWFGDRENILMSDGSRIAYLDIFQSEDTAESINSHIDDKYTSRGFKLLGFFGRMNSPISSRDCFPGKSFDIGRRELRLDRPGSGGLSRWRLPQLRRKTRAEFKALAESHPNLAQYVKLGMSFEGREIFALKITRDPALDQSSKPDALITGCHHAPRVDLG